jgi:hypothetical protein
MEQKQTCTPQERALAVEKAIWKAVDAGKLVIRNGTYGRIKDGFCEACAVGSAARAVAVCGLNIDSMYTRGELVEALEGHGVMTYQESLQIESGFETSWARGRILDGDADTRAEGPWFELGERLYYRKRPA